MLVQDSRLTKRARMLRHAHNDSPDVLKVRMPQLFGGGDDDDDNDDDDGDDDDGLETTVRTTSTPRPTTTSTRATTTSSITSIELSTTVTSSTSSTIPATSTTSSTSTAASPTSSVPVSVTTSSSTSSISSTTRVTRTTSASSTASLLTSTSTTSTSALANSQTASSITRTVSSRTSTIASSTGTVSSSTASSTSSSGISTAGIIGIAGASIVGTAVLAGIVMFFLRRWNRKEDEFDPDAFRRQSTVLRDDNTSLHRGNSNNHYPRPPTMFERHNQNVAAFNIPPSNGYGSSSYQHGAPSPYSDFAGSSPSMAFAPGMYVPASAFSPAPTGQYANAPPFFNPAYQSHPSAGSYGAGYDAQSQVVRSPSNGASSVLTRNNSVVHPQYSAEETEYADLNRASVTPFQAAQYEAISKQLNIPPPMPLHRVAEAEEAEELHNSNKGASPVSGAEPKLVSPFEDPVGPTSEIHATEPVQRVTSQPPSLPEFQMVTGSFSPVNMSFPVTASPRKGSFDVQGGRASPKVDLPPLSPVPSSPQVARFVDGMEARAHDGHETPVEIGFIGDDTAASKEDVQPPAQTKGENNKSQTAKRPETVYDAEDAYGGI